ncbi:hypothetical protein [Pseudonocardia spinosispora]|uniref:hypothetical protein n=1 Tax=Pseudonocardia spinosispora TaxID=103441 RepID=UPI0003F54547|nr:hypothetical protein [Pseudonocardia spinosispora]
MNPTEVTPENVLRVRAVLLAEADRLGRSIGPAEPDGWVGACGGDPLSSDARSAFNERIEATRERCRGQVDRLRVAGHSLEDVARSYGHTDAAIAASCRRLS